MDLRLFSPRPRGRARRVLLSLGLLAGLLVSGCSRKLPEVPSDSPLASDAPAGTPARLNVSLESDPPLPGEKVPGWEGLGEAKPVDHSAHHHHGHGKQPAPEPAEQHEGHGDAVPTDPHANHGSGGEHDH